MLPRASDARIVIRLMPGTRETDAVQFGSTKVAAPLAPLRLLDQDTLVTPTLSVAVPVIVRGRVWVTTLGGAGVRIVTAGAVISKITVSVAEEVFPTPSVAVTEITLVPEVRGTEADQAVVPVAVPVVPVVVLAKVTLVTTRLSDEVPEMSRGLIFVLYVPVDVGPVMLTDGATGS